MIMALARHFFTLPLLASIRKTPAEHWSIEHWSKSFDFEGTHVWSAPDFGYWTPDGRLALVDWKTGGGGGEGGAATEASGGHRRPPTPARASRSVSTD